MGKQVTRKIFISLFVMIISINSVGDRLDIPYYWQSSAGWCWAGSAAMVLNYYGVSVKPCQLAKEWNKDYSEGMNMFEILDLLNTKDPQGNYKSTLVSPINWDVKNFLKSRVDAGQPVIINLFDYAKGTQHYIVITGTSDIYVYINDPSGAFVNCAIGGAQADPLVGFEMTWDIFFDLIDTTWYSLDGAMIWATNRANDFGSGKKVTIDLCPSQWPFLAGGITVFNSIIAKDILFFNWDGSGSYPGYYYDTNYSNTMHPLDTANDNVSPDVDYGYRFIRNDLINFFPVITNCSCAELNIRLNLSIKLNETTVYTDQEDSSIMAWNHLDTLKFEVPVTSFKTIQEGVYTATLLAKVEENGEYIEHDSVTISFHLEPDSIPTFSIQAVAGSYGSISPAGSMTVALGSDIQFTATPDSGYVVEQWYLDGFIIPGTEGATSYTLSNVQKDTSVIVLFKQSTTSIGQLNITSSNPNTNVSIQVSPNDTIGQGTGTTPFSRTYNYGTSVTLTAPATASGNTFLKWQKNYADFSSNTTILVAANSSDIYTAIYSSTGQTLTKNASADAYVHQYYPTTNFGDGNILYTTGYELHDSSLYYSNILIKFNLTEIPPNSTIQWVELQMPLQSYLEDRGFLNQIRVCKASKSWSEMSVDWGDNVFASTTIAGYLDQGKTTSIWTWNSDDYSQLKTTVQGWVNNSSSNYGFHISSDPGVKGMTFYARENLGSKPKLVINYMPAPMKDISGYVRTSDNIPVAGVFLDSTGGTAITNADGYYSESVPVGWSGRFTPTKEGYNFNPSYIDYSSVSANMSNQNYTATLQQRVISGYIGTADGIAIGQVTIYTNNGGGTVVSGADGSYAVPVPYGWTGQVVPGKSGYSFMPLYKDYSGVTVNQTGQDYIGTVYTYTISGFIRTLSGNGYSGVTVSTSDGLSSATTDSNGFYSLVVGYGWTGVVTPTKEGCLFTPESKSYPAVTTNYLMQDYVIEPSADINNSKNIDLEDYELIARKWEKSCSEPDWCERADIDHSGSVDLSDLMIMVDQWLEGTSLIPDDMIYIPGGTFQMGNNSFSGEGYSNELPVHSVKLSPFYMGKYEITNGQYCEFLNSAFAQGLITNPTTTSNVVYKADSGTMYPYCYTYQSSNYSQINWDGSTFSVRTKSGRSMINDPMLMVSWYGSVAYCNWRSQQEGKQACYNLTTWERDISKKGYHLPTEAQWEYAARGGLSGKRFPWGDTISQTQANFYSYYYSYDVSPDKYQNHPLWNDGVEPYTSPVGFFDGGLKYKSAYNWPGSSTSYQTTSGANDFGLYGMAGNVWEWCNDWYGSSYYSSSPNSNPTGPTTGTYRVLRGGGWHSHSGFCRVAYRGYDFYPYDRYFNLGFRIAQSDNSVPPPSTPMVWWKMDETSGTIVSDSIGGHNGATINMTKPWVTGHLNNALNFDGMNDYVEIAGFMGITGTASRSCAAWIKAAFNGQEQEIISWGNGANGEKWMFRLQPDRRLAVGVWGGYIYSNTTIADSEWHHVAAVLENDGSPSVNEIILYIDGVAQTGTYNTTQAINTASSQNVQIGSVYNGTNQTSFFSGIIDEVQIYDWALTQDEILQQAMK